MTTDTERLRDLLMDLGNMPDEWELNAAGLAGRLIQAGVRLPAQPASLDGLRDCDVVPGSLGGFKSIPWCRSHNRYASTCEAVAATL